MPAQTSLLIQTLRDVTVVDMNERQIRDMFQIQKIGERLYDIVDNQNCKKLILDFSKVQMLSSAALGTLVTLEKKSKAIKGKLFFCGVHPKVRELFKISRLEKLFKFYDTESDALAAFGVTTGG